jgi:N-acetylglucosamine-6-phosphate deacetylase
LHREPGLVGAAADFGARVELICDGFHLHPAVIRAMFKLFGAEKICMISDSLSCAGLKDGQYNLAEQDVTVSGGKATLADGTLAGSSINLLIALQRAVSYGVRLEDAVLACTKTPALSVGIGDSIGAIEEGFFGDCLVLEKNLALRHVIKAGVLVA